MNSGLDFVAEFTVELGSPHELGRCAEGMQRIIPIVGGAVAGPRLNGRILNVGADWQTVFSNGVARLDARYAMITDDGVNIEIESQGIRHASPEIAARIAAGEHVEPSEYYMRTAVRLTTGHNAYGWVNRVLFLSAGGKTGSVVTLRIFEVL